jgi:RNA polymerase sigma-70 factor (ECF subfamily)
MSAPRPNVPDHSLSTDWSNVIAAGSKSCSDQAKALNELLQRYIPVLTAHLHFKKRLSPDQAEDLVQGFIQEKILDRELFKAATPSKGKFRTFLLTALDHFVIDRWRKESRASAGQMPAGPLAVEPGPDIFDVAWAMQVLLESVLRTQAECQSKQRSDLWGIFEGRTLAPLRGAPPLPYELLAERYRLQSGKQAANRHVIAVAMFRRNFRQVIAEYAGAEVETEVEDFRTIFSHASADLVEQLRIHLWSRLPEVTVASSDQHRIDPHLLAEMMGLPLQPMDPAALLRQVLTAPVPLDLGGLEPATTRTIKEWAEGQGLVLKSFADLLAHPNPLPELLELMKDFAKELRNDPESQLSREVATVLYYCSIAVALARCRRRITKHDDATLRQGFQWGVDQPWVDETTRNQLRAGLQHLEGAAAG